MRISAPSGVSDVYCSLTVADRLGLAHRNHTQFWKAAATSIGTSAFGGVIV
jgi:hypothetical protein